MANEGKFEIKLLNQVRDVNHSSSILDLVYDDRVTEDKGIGWGYECFIANKCLCWNNQWWQYLKDDCLFSK